MAEVVDPFDLAAGQRLKAAREARNLTQDAVAKALGLRSEQQVSRYETGRRGIHPELLARWAALLDLSTDYVLTGIAPLAHDPRLEPILSSTDLESLLDELRCTRPERMSIYTHLRQFTHHRVTRSYIESAVAWLRNPTGATMEESAVTAASDADLKALRDEDEGDD